MSNEFYKKDPLSNVETTILNAIWKADKEISFEDLMKTMQDIYDPNYKRTTLATFLTRLSDKGYIQSVRRGKFAYITAVISKDEYAAYILKKTLDYWFDGDKKKLKKELENI